MSKLNQRGTNRPNIVKVAAAREEKLAVSANGNLQFKKEPLQMLYELVVQTLVGKSGQLKSSDQLVKEIKANVKIAVDMGAYDFVANLAIHARGEMNIRTAPIVLVVEFAKALSDKRQAVVDEIKRLKVPTSGGVRTMQVTPAETVKWMRIKQLDAIAANASYPNMRQLVRDVIQRADQITDLYAYALEVFGGKNKIPLAVKRGVADAFNKFGEYAFAKYNRDGAVKFRDVLRIVHPTAMDEKHSVIFDKIMKEALTTPYTWETELSANGQRPPAERKSNKDLWTELVKSGQVGYMALLRNLRNIDQAGLDADVLRTYVLNVICDPVQVKNSKQLPFDFMEAYNIVKPLNPKMATAVSKAIDLSVANMPELGKRPWLIVDYSQSMGYAHVSTSAYSSAIFLAAVLLKMGENADHLAVTIFGSSARTLAGVDTNNSILAIMDELNSYRKGSIAGSTNFGAALAEKKGLGYEPDTIIVLTDNEVNDFPYGTIKNIAGKSVMKMAVNLSASTSTPMSKNDGWYAMAGWSTAMFRWMPAIRDASSVVDMLAGPYVPAKRLS